VAADRKRDFGATAHALAAWLGKKIAAADQIVVADLKYPVGAGLSNETILFGARWNENGRSNGKSFVARLHPGEFQMFLEPAFESQFRLLELIGRDAWLRVPKMCWQESDPSILGQPFFVMDQVSGRVPVSFPAYNVSGWLADAAPRDRERAWLSAMDQFARIHRVPTEEVRFMHRPQYGSTGFEDEFQYWMRSSEWAAAGKMPPAIAAAAQWLQQNRPAAPIDGLSWGDARIGNMIFDDDFQVAAVLDWEQASLAGGLQDLGWWLLFDDLYSTGIGVKRLDGLGTRQQTIDLWQELTGRRADDLRWYEAYAAFKTAVLGMRKHRLEKKCTPANNAGNNVATRWLGDFLGLPAPADMA
jgi:aminoglycoside phosphotransferase (APT) family kinase protein